MKKLAKAYLSWRHGGREVRVDAQFNPTQLSFEKSVQIAEIAIPERNTPIQQFVHGKAGRLTVELFFDTTDESADGDAKAVTKKTDPVYALTQTVPEDHAPPVVTFHYGRKGFPGEHVPSAFGSQRRKCFVGLVESVNQQFTLFSSDGVPLRAKLTVAMREYIPLHDQFSETNPQSPDRSHGHELSERETLSDLAWQYYRRSGDWRAIALENGVEDPRRIDPGLRLNVPRIE